MNDLIIFPDAEAVLIRLLSEALTEHGDATPVINPSAQRPGPQQMYVKVSILGGSTSSLTIEWVNFAIDAIGPDEDACADLAALIRALIPTLAYAARSPVLGTTEISRPVLFPDPLTDEPAYTQQHQIRIRSLAA